MKFKKALGTLVLRYEEPKNKFVLFIGQQNSRKVLTIKEEKS